MAALLAAAGTAAAAATGQPQGGAASEPTSSIAAATAEPSLQPADGALRHLFSVSFTADHAVLATVTGLVAQRVARTASGGEIEVTFPPGVPYPQGAVSVIVRDLPDPANRTAVDHLAAPPELLQRQGATLVTSYRHGGRLTQYLIVWRDQSTGEHSVTLFDASKPRAPELVIARSRVPILGVAQSPSTLAADYYLTVWTSAETLGDVGEVTVEAYTWRPPAT